MSLHQITQITKLAPPVANMEDINPSPAKTQVKILKIQDFLYVNSIPYQLGLALHNSINRSKKNYLPEIFKNPEAMNIFPCHLATALFKSIAIKNEFAIRSIFTLENQKKKLEESEFIAPEDLSIALILALKANLQKAIDLVFEHQNSQNITAKYLGPALIQSILSKNQKALVRIFKLPKIDHLSANFVYAALLNAIIARNNEAISSLINLPGAKEIKGKDLIFALMQAAYMDYPDAIIAILKLPQFIHLTDESTNCLRLFKLESLDISKVSNPTAKTILIKAKKPKCEARKECEERFQ